MYELEFWHGKKSDLSSIENQLAGEKIQKVRLLAV